MNGGEAGRAPSASRSPLREAKYTCLMVKNQQARSLYI